MRKRLILLALGVALAFAVVFATGSLRTGEQERGRLPLHVPNDIECAESHRLAEEMGLTLQPGWIYLCPSGATDWDGGDHEGITCPYRDCPAGDGPYIAANPGRVENQSHLNAVVLHESVHMLRFTGALEGDPFDECSVDREAARRGANPAYLNYCPS